jgi:hypothetical protein
VSRSIEREAGQSQRRTWLFADVGRACGCGMSPGVHGLAGCGTVAREAVIIVMCLRVPPTVVRRNAAGHLN